MRASSRALRFGAHRIWEGAESSPGSFAALPEAARIPTLRWENTVFSSIVGRSRVEISSLADSLFQPPWQRDDPSAEEARPGGVSFVTAPGEASEVRSIARLILKAAGQGTPFDEMAVALPQPEVYAPILVDLFSRAKIPFKLHPSFPLGTGRIARSFRLLLASALSSAFLSSAIERAPAARLTHQALC